MVRVIFLVSWIAALGIVSATRCSADQLSVVDCSEQTRFAQEITPGIKNTLTLAFESTAAGSLPNIVLSNSANGQNLLATKIGNRLRFDDIDPGRWKYCAENNQDVSDVIVTFEENGRAAPGPSASAMLGGGGAVVGLGTLIALSIGGSDSGGSSVTGGAAGGSVTPDSPPAAVSGARPIGPGQSSSGGNVIGISADDGTCFVGDDSGVVPISPFS